MPDTNLPGQIIFTRLASHEEVLKILNDLAQAKGDLLAKKSGPEDQVFIFHVLKSENNTLICTTNPPAQMNHDSGDLICSFFLGGEKYFMQTQYQVRDRQLLVKTPEDIYHLQRREDYRIKIPNHFKALFEVHQINDKYIKYSLPIWDLSGGGCRLCLNDKKYKLNAEDELHGHLFFPDRQPTQVHAVIRHVRPGPDKETSLYGLQFLGMSEMQKNRIAAVVLDLYREFFLKRK